MKKSDIKNGAIVKLRNGNYYLKIDDTLLEICIVKKEDVKCDCDRIRYDQFHIFLRYNFMPFDLYESDLTYEGNDNYSIIAVDNDVSNNNGYCNMAVAGIIRKGPEVSELPILTKVEKAIIDSIDTSKWKWIARDEDGHLYLYFGKPEKDKEIKKWFYNCTDLNDREYVSEFWAFDHMFKFISWDDSEPYEIKKIISRGN